MHHTRMALPWPVQSGASILKAAEGILLKLTLKQPVRLLGVSAYDLRDLGDMSVQPFLFPELMGEEDQLDWLEGFRKQPDGGQVFVSGTVSTPRETA